MGEEFEKIEELIKEYMLERYKNLYERKKEIEHLRKLYNEIIEENGNLKIENYWTKHVLHFKNKGFETVVEKVHDFLNGLGYTLQKSFDKLNFPHDIAKKIFEGKRVSRS